MGEITVKPAMLPGLLGDVARLTDVYLALRLARRWGGQDLYFPTRIAADHPIAREIGLRAAERLCRALAPGTLRVPGAKASLRWVDGCVLRGHGFSNRQIAALLGLSTDHVSEILRGITPDLASIDDRLVRETRRHYRAALARAPLPARQRPPSAQLDFGFPPATGGRRYTFA